MQQVKTDSRNAVKMGPGTLYGSLDLNLYPPEYLQQHRVEMLQNFLDLQHESSSNVTLWLFVGRDLVISLTSQLAEERMTSLNTLSAYVIGVLIVWAVIFAGGYFLKGSTPGHPALHVFGGFLLGMLSMYIATRVYSSKRNHPTP
jgi:hypothetical protein